MVFRQNKALTFLLIVGLLGAVCGLEHRYRAEMKNRAVEIAVDYTELTQIAGASNVSVSKALDTMTQAGVTSIAVQERTVGDILSQRLADLNPASTAETTVLTENEPRVLQQLVDSGLGVRKSTNVVQINGSLDYAQAMPAGIPQQAADIAREHKIPVVARLVNYPGVKPANVEKVATALQGQGVKTVIFAAEQVLGFRDEVDDVANILQRHNLSFGTVEFAKQKGDAKLSQKMLPNVIRVHSITGAEMGTLDKVSATDRFVKAARERNIRLMYIRMYDMSAANPLEANADYVAGIRKGLVKKGFTIEQSHPFTDPNVPMPSRALIGIGAAAAAVLLLLSLFKLGNACKWGTFVLATVVFAALAASGIPIAVKLVALAVALIFPTLAVVYAMSGTPDQPTQKPVGAYIVPAVLRFCVAFAITMTGAMMIGGLLAKLPFMLHIDQFVGVKFANFLPILVVGGLIVTGIGWSPEVWAKQKNRAIDNLRKIGNEPVRYWQSVLAVVLLAVIGLVIARSGNDSGLEVSGLELKFRSLLDTLLFVRPRTKELFLGHPAMIAGIAAALGGRKNLAGILIVIGTIGEVGALNTFCHIHTPIVISVARSVIGAVLGIIIGVFVLWMCSRALRPAEKRHDESREVTKSAV